MSDWNRVTGDRPCEICGKPDWCSVRADQRFVICRRVDNGSGRLKRDRGGADYWVYARDAGQTTLGLIPRAAAPPSREKAFAEHLDRVYRELLARLALAPIDARALSRRGLPPETIAQNLYRTLPHAGRAELARDLAAHFGRRLVLATPGFVQDASKREGFDLTLSGPEGLLVPVREAGGRIVALKIRRRGEGAPKYVYLSSASRGGPGPGAPVHVPIFAQAEIFELGSTGLACVRLTEGELKADVASALGDLPTLSVAGVSTWRQALPTLRALGAKTCRLAFDMDLFSNAFVAKALREAAVALVEAGFALEFETWPRDLKGIDECLAAGQKTEVLRGPSALHAIVGIALGARAG